METATSSPKAGLLNSVVLIGLGLISAGIAALIISEIELRTGYYPYGFTLLFIVPVGAFACGVVAAAGVFAAGRVLHVRPGKLLGLLVPVSLGIATFFAANYLTYIRMDIGGLQVSDLLNFGDYLRTTITAATVSFRSTVSTDEVGSLGYALTAVELVGFAAGSYIVVNALNTIPWCSTCERYLGKTGKSNRMFENTHEYETTANVVVDHALAGEYEAITPLMQGDVKARKAILQLMTRSYSCPRCSEPWMIVSGSQRNGNNWNDLFSTARHPEPPRYAETTSAQG